MYGWFKKNGLFLLINKVSLQHPLHKVCQKFWVQPCLNLNNMQKSFLRYLFFVIVLLKRKFLHHWESNICISTIKKWRYVFCCFVLTAKTFFILLQILERFSPKNFNYKLYLVSKI